MTISLLVAKSKTHTPQAHEKLQVLQQVAIELMSSHDLKETLAMIVNKAIDLLICDAGSLFVKNDEKTLIFEIAQNRSSDFEFKKQLIPIDGKGLAAYSFRTGQELLINDVEKTTGLEPYSFNSAIDSKTGYRTRSVLICPLKSKKGEILGVLQIVNRKQRRDQVWPSDDLSQIEKMPHFTKEDAEFLKSFAAIASASLENSKLYKDIENLFEGFVTASVHAIESRDLATRGHSDRVAHLTVELAKKISDSSDKEVKDYNFTKTQIAEIRYAALLHDFGKIGVRESTLLKEEKLNPLQRLSIRSRFDNFKNATEIRILRDYLKSLMQENRMPKDFEVARLENQIQTFGLEIEKYWDLVLDLNRPTVLDAEKSEKLDLLARVECKDCNGHSKKLLDEDESFALKIKKGSLTEDERLEIESHVTHTFEFLKKIPWTPQLRKIPEIAFGHHERLSGRGYPRKLTEEGILPQARIMAICDIFDALVASDRPYKPSLPTQKALDILEMQTRAGDLDAKFFKVFLEAKVWENQDFQRDLKANSNKTPTPKKVA
jgi:HD-GYP domain-containing protein (c-di-GMP phosphodiesterase class II)